MCCIARDTSEWRSQAGSGGDHASISALRDGSADTLLVPKQDVRIDLLVPSDRATRCLYKGVARYWSARVGDELVKGIVWAYPAPIPECPKIENLLSFYNENVDVFVDGDQEERPKTRWS
jgi:uncharacterized protein (DUF427 family)